MSKHDKHRIDIAVGGTHRGKVANKTTTVRKLREQLSDPLVDKSISYAQYQALSVDEKGARKAMAGYIMPGHFTDGIRKISHQQFRSLVALDLDNVSHQQLDLIRECLVPLRRFYWFMHTTRSHCPERPRVRIFLPLTRNVNAEEAYALTRLVSLLLADDPEEAIEIPDLVSFRYNQIMYLPSISRNQEFWTDENPNAPILDVDEFLAEFPTWRDISTLPRQEGEKDARQTDPNAKMEDPREKAGLIGAFCRAYTVQEAISEFLPDIYTPGDSSTEERYTYQLGTASNGGVVYDDGLFFHSHHGSDPAEGLHNAWDLVRIHLFGHLDKDAHGNTSPSNMPSFKAMREFAEKDKRTVIELSSNMADAFDDLEDEDEEADDEGADDDEGPESDDLPEDEVDPDIADLVGEVPKAKKKAKKEKVDLSWTAGFRRKANGDLEPVLHNVSLICENDPRIAPCIGYNELTLDPVAFKPIRGKGFNLASPPIEDRKGYRGWADGDDISIRRICSAPTEQGGWQFDPARTTIEEAVLIAGKRQAFHPIRDRIKEYHAAWVAAGRPEGLIDTLPQRYLGCPDDDFHRESSRTLMTALCARTFEPGIKFDAVTIIRGEQGGRKSGFWRALAMDDYFHELPKDFDKTDRMIEAMRGRLILEMGEMAGLRKETAETAKEFITRTEDQHRLAYASRVGIYKRQSVLVGTSNLTSILHDPTGNRRFWIWVDRHSEDDPIDIDGLRAELPMLYGEAYQAYLDRRAAMPGAPDLFLDLQSAAARAGRDKLAEQYRERTAVEIIAEAIQDWLDTPVSAAEADTAGADMFDSDEADPMFLRNMVTAKETFLALHGDPSLGSYRNADVRTFGKAFNHLRGWRSVQMRRFGRKDRWYVREGQPDTLRFIPAPTEDEFDGLI